MTNQPDPIADAKTEKPYTVFVEIGRRPFFGGICDMLSDETRQAYYVAGIAPMHADGYVVKLQRRMLAVDSAAAPVIDRDRWRMLKEHLLSLGGDSTELVPAIKMRKSVLAWMKQLEENGRIVNDNPATIR